MRRWLGLAIGVGTILGAPGTADAFCRSTTCKPSVSCEEDPEKCCIPDGDGCDTNGIPLFWPTTCVSFNVAEAASPLRGIDVATFAPMVDSAITRWLAPHCEEALAPSILVEARGPIECGVAEYSSDFGNANLWLFRDDEWPYSYPGNDTGTLFSNALALTTLSYNFKTGEIYDADVELNSKEVVFTVGDGAVRVDLESILTHEAGHFLGLDHSLEAGATMTSGYFDGTTEHRTLDGDDIAGICAAYPSAGRTATENSCEPRHGYAEVCAADASGCSVQGAPDPRGKAGRAGALFGALGLLGLGLGRRRFAGRRPWTLTER